jgi:hypothetical protein
MTRGENNCNPGNIRKGDTVWAGQSRIQDDPDFVQFNSAEYGIRAIVRILRSYKRAGVNTIQDAIDRWAPPNENETGAYVSDVCNRCGIGPDAIVDFDQIMLPLVKAIITHENGECSYPDGVIDEGISLA